MQSDENSVQSKTEFISENIEEAREIMGSLNRNSEIIDRAFSTESELSQRGIEIRGTGEAANWALKVYEALADGLRTGAAADEQRVLYLIDSLKAEGDKGEINFIPGFIAVSAGGRTVKSKTAGQAAYVKAVEDNDLTFAIGPAGTGKTYIAVAMAVKAFRRKEVKRIILTRPAVEAGEKLGFLPGDLQSKVDPYMRPLYDALNDLMGPDAYLKNQEKGLIEVSPLAYMRGRTLDNAFIILDEAQNTTPEQMKMFLTRIGFNSKAVVTGDDTQVDLPGNTVSGLFGLKKILGGVDGIKFINLSSKDAVRSPLVQKIIKAYEKQENIRNKAKNVKQHRKL